MEEEKPITSITSVRRDGSYSSLSTELDNKTMPSSIHINELSESPSTSSGVTTISTIPSVQQKKTKPFKLADAIKPIEYDEMQRMSTDSFHRILHAEG